MLNLVTASAGSGKTFRLAGEYLQLLLESESAYRHILAVTFTNKATEEMKDRILRHLFLLAGSPEKSPYFGTLSGQGTGMTPKGASPQEISVAARKVLTAILNDYSAFSVSTIDRFFQRTMRSFARELGIFSSYAVELDRKAVYEEGTDAMIDSLSDGSDDELLRWLTDMAVEAVEKGENWNIRDRLKAFGISVFSEEFRLKSDGLPRESILDRRRISTLRAQCRSAISSYQEQVVKYASGALSCILSSGLPLTAFIRGARGPFMKLQPLAEGKLFQVPDSLLSMAGAPASGWVSKTSPDKAAVEALYPQLNPLLEALAAHVEAESCRYNTALAVKDCLSVLGVMSDIARHTSDILRERNLVMLDDTNETLSRIIGEDETPFIYEKMGTRYDHYMLDEFQDTSRLQWNNFRPLIADSLAGGNSSLVVGDVKQSIYRWRSGDWTILGRDLPADFGSRLSVSNLGINWRSAEEIVRFNNGFFTWVPGRIGGEAPGVYSNVFQDQPSGDGQRLRGGYVGIRFPSASDEGFDTCSSVCGTVRDLVSRGFGYEDIAVLVRTNVQGGEIVSAFIAEGIPVVSEDSLYLSNSAAVARAVDSLRACAAGDMAAAEGESLYSLCERFVDEASDESQKAGEAPYIYTFLDKVHDYMFQYGSDISRFLVWWKQNSSRITIPPPKGARAVQVMTIHKSKGLDFKAVIVPFFELPLYRRDTVWCRLPEEMFGTAMLVPVSLSKSSLGTCFAGDYETERRASAVDNLNIAYVAFTRAVHELHVICSPIPDPVLGGSKAPGEKISELLYGFCGDSVHDGMYEAGCKTVLEHVQDRPCGQEPAAYVRHVAGDRLRLSLDSSDFFCGEGRRERGKVLHSVMERIDCPQDVPQAVRSAVLDGIVPASMEQEYADLLSSALASPAVGAWFSPGASVMKECSIISPGGEVSRPDRVVLEEDRTIVVDYKFGEEKVSYVKQMRKYLSLLSKMGLPRPEGHLWYVDEGRISDVSL